MNKDKARESIHNMSRGEKIYVANLLNEWKFPDTLKEYEPLDWNEIPNYLPRNNTGIRNKFEDEMFRFLLDELDNLTTRKERLRYHHIANLHRTLWDFEKWWYLNKIKKFFKIGVHSKKSQLAKKHILTEISTKETQKSLKYFYKAVGNIYGKETGEVE